MEGRTRGQAIEIDGVTHAVAPEAELRPGDRAIVTITGADDADLWGTIDRGIPAPAPAGLGESSAGLDLASV
ncbi:MAG: hypothetical protein GWN79_13965, partial [Actinobacteria bacterium]|nr:hypothetical protein [Actinomycetota bacterium]NIT98533.1 hypothetical protein [Actinomycetota bacterium]NIU20126.1 hypothetical protein [Actinomycetota bacterium]NIU70684.1 hypothetical protein [Actinomycetota bacterium]NIV58708.1 hypothetical protein [Actinomycetota bacterium]